MLTLQMVKKDLRVFHDFDDDLITQHMVAAQREALEFCNRRHWRHGTPADVMQAEMLLIRAAYEGADPEQYRKAAETKLMPHRRGMGI